MKKLGNFSLIQQIDALIYSAGTIVFECSFQKKSATRYIGEDKQLSSSLASRSQLAKIQKVEDNSVDLQVSTLVDQRS